MAWSVKKTILHMLKNKQKSEIIFVKKGVHKNILTIEKKIKIQGGGLQL